MGDIGTTLSEIDEDMRYLGRSFCIVELYATVSGEGRLLCNLDWFLAAHLSEHAATVDAKAATTRSTRDKTLIDDFIESDIGFSGLNRVVTEAMVEGVSSLQKM